MERITRRIGHGFRRQDISALMFVLFLSLAMVAILAVAVLRNMRRRNLAGPWYLEMQATRPPHHLISRSFCNG